MLGHHLLQNRSTTTQEMSLIKNNSERSLGNCNPLVDQSQPRG